MSPDGDKQWSPPPIPAEKEKKEKKEKKDKKEKKEKKESTKVGLRSLSLLCLVVG